MYIIRKRRGKHIDYTMYEKRTKFLSAYDRKRR